MRTETFELADKQHNIVMEVHEGHAHFSLGAKYTPITLKVAHWSEDTGDLVFHDVTSAQQAALLLQDIFKKTLKEDDEAPST